MAYLWPAVDLDVERLLANWRWLCPQKLILITRSAFGDLFLRDEEGKVFWLDVAIGSFSQVAESETQFFFLCEDTNKLDEWFAVTDARAATERGLVPGPRECIGFSVPLVFREAGSPDTPYVIDIYENVGFLGDLHRQIATLPDGASVKLIVEKMAGPK